MHEYSKQHPRPQYIYFILATAAAGIPTALSAITNIFTNHIPIELSLSASTLGAYGILFYLFNTHIWKFSPAQVLTKCPNINGTWTCSGITTFHNFEPATFKWDAEITITQTWSRISILLKTTSSDSRSITASVAPQEDGSVLLTYLYDNTPTGAQDTLNRHTGVCIIVISNDKSSGQGLYYTDTHRKTAGNMKLSRR